MNNVYFGIEKFFSCKYNGNLIVNDWFVRKLLPILNGFTFDHIIYEYEEIFDVTNETEYYEIIYDDVVRYFKKIKINTFIISNYSVKNLYLSVDLLIYKNFNFFYIIDCGDYLSINNIILSDKILKSVKEKKCKILLNTSYEPYSNREMILLII